jgi:hypothetical protein
MHLIYIILLLRVECQAVQNNVHEKAILISCFLSLEMRHDLFLIHLYAVISFGAVIYNLELLYIVFVY